MRILIEHGSTDLNNLGDIAMLQVTFDRLRKRFPGAQLLVIVRSAESLARHLPAAAPLEISYPASWMRLRKFMPPHRPTLPASLRMRLETHLSRRLPADYKQSLEGAVAGADLVVHAGAGIFADPFLPAAIRRLDLLKRARELGRLIVLFSQGFGPLGNHTLRKAVAATFLGVSRIAVRDRQSGRLLAQVLGSEASRFPVTGDDALTLAYHARRPSLGERLGINARLAPYSGARSSTLPPLASLIGPAKPFPHSDADGIVLLAVHESDFDSGSRWLRQAGWSQHTPKHDATVPGLIQAISECRLVVTGSYHGAVLALGQGIPAICLVHSAYYQHKFGGLAEQFPLDCRVISWEGHRSELAFSDLASELLAGAESRRQPLLELVRGQIEASQAVSQAWLDELAKAT